MNYSNQRTAMSWTQRAAAPAAWLKVLRFSPRMAAQVCLGVALAGGFTPGHAQTTTLNFSMPRAATTSAGVYTAQGQLVRTLWRAENLPAGPQSRSWDQRDDNGRLVADGNYQVKLLHHNLQYVWEGVIGNSSTSSEGSQVHRAFQVPKSLAIGGSQLFYAVGYNEAQDGIHGFELSAPQLDTPVLSADPYVDHTMVAADSYRLYWTNNGTGLAKGSFVGVFNFLNGQPDYFTDAGVQVCPDPNTSFCSGGAYLSVIDVQADAAQTPTGLAVQLNGPVLAVAHGGLGVIRLFDKSTGGLLRELSLPLVANASNQLAMAPNGDLWVISGNAVRRYTNLSGTPTLVLTINGFSNPLALATSPGNDEVWVADGGASQQVKRFDRKGRALAVIGTLGGYASDPTVRGNKLCFRDAGGQEQTAMAVTPGRALWVVDYCNNRMLRFSLGRASFDAQVAYLPVVYASTVNHGNQRRVFANFLEFDVNTATPLAAGASSWTLKRNWLAGLPPELKDDWARNSAYGGFISVETLGNGRTYGLIQTKKNQQYVVELPSSGPLRIVKALAGPAPGATAYVMYENGDLGYAVTDANNGTQTAFRLKLSGFDGSGNPIWSGPTSLASVPTSDGSPYFRLGTFSGSMPPRFPLTGSGNVVFFDQSAVGNEGFHLGAAPLNGSGWLWQASPTGELDGKGSFQTKAVDGTVNYAGNEVWAYGRHIVYGYHGEVFTDRQNGQIGQANQFMNFDESGLFLGQFGVPSTRATIPAQKGLAGNAFSPTLVGDGTRLFLYHNDESVHGGVHRWRIDGWNDVQQLSGTGSIISNGNATIVLN